MNLNEIFLLMLLIYIIGSYLTTAFVIADIFKDVAKGEMVPLDCGNYIILTIVMILAPITISIALVLLLTDIIKRGF